MRLSKQTKDAVNTLVHLACSKDQLLSIPDIAKACDMTEAITFKLIPLLVRAGFLKTERGRGGGVRLAREPAEVSVGEVVRAMETLHGTADNQSLEGSGRLDRIVDDAFEAFLQTLDETTIADMASERVVDTASFPNAASKR